ncbi:MAG: hypothetical protein WCK29_03945 [archaeon]
MTKDLVYLHFQQGRGWNKNRFTADGIDILVMDAIPIGPPVVVNARQEEITPETARISAGYENRGAQAYTVNKWPIGNGDFNAIQFYRLPENISSKK